MAAFPEARLSEGFAEGRLTKLELPFSPNRDRTSPLSERALRLLCCPGCYGDLRLKADKLCCAECATEYPVVDGIPVFVSANELQSIEYRVREEVAREWLGKSEREVLHKLGKHHNLGVMEARALSFAGRIKEGCIVDIGAGWGWQWRSHHGPCHVVAVDFSLTGCRLARSTFLRNNSFVHVVCADASRLPLRAASGIWSVQAFQHFPPQVMSVVLQECRRLAKPSGLKAEIVNQHPVVFVKVIYALFRRPYVVCGTDGRFFLHRRKAGELRDLFQPIARGLEIDYSELFFHPDVLLRWNRLYPRALEAALEKSGLGRGLARQIHIRFDIPGDREQVAGA